ncbi:RagB/SusD family nutrient uptake outer membrane protein [Maribacter luteus]|uniref:RagB/SusD family nutrient uptake outer membrane protein n=1 Tax=Maribacter luteus TaxID=2594478 RepID=UPI002492CDB1|nr:RagB/SusD family nutrient uptake outer membrane protein [Maribacter luteus]
MKKIIDKITYILVIALISISCHDDLDQSPIDPDSFTEEDVFANADEAKSALAKLYASLALTGQEGPAGDADISDIDEGTSQFTRMLFTLNELTTDTAVNGWGDPGLADLHGLYWSSSNDFTEAMYSRLGQEVSFCNSFIENAGALSGTEAESFVAEARFLRAYAYYNLIDLYANVPLVTVVETALPEQSSREELFNFVETELLEIQDLLPTSNEYGRVDQVAAWALLSRLYLNAEVWTGQDRSTDCITYSNNVINSSYSIHSTDVNGNGYAYDDLFLADNDTNGAQNEFIFVINFDGLQSQTYGGPTFLIKGGIGGSMDPTEFGVNGGWAGTRTTSALVNKFDSEGGDNRAMFYTDGQSLEIEKIAPFTQGYAITKFKNVDSQGIQGNDKSGEFADTDLPIIRLAEIYLNYAEAVLRGGTGGDLNTAVGLINELRDRAYTDLDGDISTGDLTLDFVLDERARELYWEGVRRTDLIRYDYFTTNSYLWPFKGDQPNGIAVDSYRNIFPIPFNVISTNPNIQQNDGY